MKRSSFRRKTYSEARQALREKQGKKPARFGRQKPLKAGRKVKAWEAVRRQLKREYAAMGITSCELRYDGCKVDDYLSFAHGRKRRNLIGDELKTLTILCCTPCHNKIECLSPEVMLCIVKDTIAARRKVA